MPIITALQTAAVSLATSEDLLITSTGQIATSANAVTGVGAGNEISIYGGIFSYTSCIALTSAGSAGEVTLTVR